MRAQMRLLRPLLGMVGVVALHFAGVTVSLAQGSPGPAKPATGAAGAAAKPVVDPAKGRREVVAGIKLYEKGQYSQSVSKFSGAMRIDGLSQIDMAKALYYRGLALQRQKKSAEAISDLTSALYLKDGLSESERAKAAEKRAEAYKSVGLAAPAAVVAKSSPALAAAPVAQQDGVPTLAPKAGAKPIPAASPLAPSAGAKPIPANSPLAPPPGTSTAAAQTTQTAAAAPNGGTSWSPVPQSSSTPKPVPPPASNSTGNVLTDSVNNVGNFFSNLFTGGGSNGSPPPSSQTSPIATSSTTKPAAETSDWSSVTQPTKAGSTQKPRPPAEPTQTAALTKPKPTSRAPSGKYRVQVAAVRTRSEAEQLVSMLRQKYGATLGQRVPNIDETVYGNMGTFYRVQVGPYAQPKDTKPLCSALSSSGYDCMVVTK